MSAFPTTEFKREALLKGGMYFVEKPFDIKAVREKVLDALRDHEQFRGILSGISLSDVIQVKCMSGVTGALRVSEGGRQGVIFFSGWRNNSRPLRAAGWRGGLSRNHDVP